MTEEVEFICSIKNVPTEILFNIFSFLPARDLMRCRLVCIRWKSAIDSLASNESFWLDFCRREFKDYCWIARNKASREIGWYNLYRSLCLWPKLASAQEEADEFASASRLADEVRSVEVLGDGILSVHKKSAIEYYNTETFKLAPRGPISGDYARYTENDTVIVIQNYHLHLFLIHKLLHNTAQELNATFDDVKLYYLTDDELYYVNVHDEIYVCNLLKDQKITSQFIRRTENLDGVMSLGYSNGCLNVLTYQRNIFTIVNKRDMVFKQSISNEANMLNVLYKYNLLDQLDWRVYFQWMFVLHHTVPEGPMRNIVVIRSYGDLFFVGTNNGLLTIFYHPFINGEIDLFNSKPLRQINFMERSDIPVLSTCPILQIDVLETEMGHTVFVAMPKKVAVLKYTHNFLHPASWTIKPYSDLQQALYLNVQTPD